METKIIRTPAFVNICFLALFLIPIVFFSIGRASAGTLRENYCANQFVRMHFQKVPSIVQERCGKIFENETQKWFTGNY